MKHQLRGNSIILLLLIFLFSLFFPGVAQAQETTCPPGYSFDRMSGVGCVQDNCFAIGVLDYTGHCRCLEGYQACTISVDYSGFDMDQCGPFCPTSELVACIQAPNVCPSDEVVAPPIQVPGIEIPSIDIGSIPIGDLGRYITGPAAREPNPITAAAAATLVTALFGSWVVFDRMRELDILIDFMDAIDAASQDLLDQVSKGIKNLFKKQAKSYVADPRNTSSILKMLDSSSESEKPDAALSKQKQQLSAVDRTAEAFLKGGSGTKSSSPTTLTAHPPEDIPKAKASKPLEGKFTDARSRVFEGDEAMIILKELEKIDQNISRKERIQISRPDLDNLIGPHPDGQPREITLPGGRKVVITKVEAILIGNDHKKPSGREIKQIDFNQPVVITAELVDPVPPDPPKLTQPAPNLHPAPSGPPIQPQNKPTSGTASAQPPPKPVIQPNIPASSQPPPLSGAAPPAQPPSPPPPAGPSSSPVPRGPSLPDPDLVPDVDPETGKVIMVDRETKALLDESRRLLNDDLPPDPDPRPLDRDAGEANIMDQDDIENATDDF